MDILHILSTCQPVSGEEIARRLNISRAAVHKRILKLRALGYTIIGRRKAGYSLVGRPDRLLPEELRDFLPPACAFGRSFIHARELDSTQNAARRLAAEGAPEGTVVVAERQSGAYGRLQRAWASPEGGIWFSLILRPPLPPERAPALTLVVSLAVRRALERLHGLDVRIKWPNDIIIGDRKAAGILTELSAEVGRTNWAVTGVGLNANNEIPPDLRDAAVSLRETLGNAVDRPRLLAAILTECEGCYAKFCREGFGAFAGEYNDASWLRGRNVRLESRTGVIEGVAAGVDGDGFLRLRLPDGRETTVIAGDISLTRRA